MTNTVEVLRTTEAATQVDLQIGGLVMARITSPDGTVPYEQLGTLELARTDLWSKQTIVHVRPVDPELPPFVAGIGSVTQNTPASHVSINPVQ